MKAMKKLINAFLVLYTFNYLAPVAWFIPINIINLSLVSVFNIPALFFLVIIKLYT